MKEVFPAEIFLQKVPKLRDKKKAGKASPFASHLQLLPFVSRSPSESRLKEKKLTFFSILSDFLLSKNVTTSFTAKKRPVITLAKRKEVPIIERKVEKDFTEKGDVDLKRSEKKAKVKRDFLFLAKILRNHSGEKGNLKLLNSTNFQTLLKIPSLPAKGVKLVSKLELPLKESERGSFNLKKVKFSSVSKEIVSLPKGQEREFSVSSFHHLAGQQSRDSQIVSTSTETGREISLKEFIRSHYEPLKEVVKFYVEVSKEGSVKVLLNKQLGIAKLLFLSQDANFLPSSHSLHSLANTLSSLGFFNVSIAYATYSGSGDKRNGNTFGRNQKEVKFLKEEPEEEYQTLTVLVDVKV